MRRSGRVQLCMKGRKKNEGSIVQAEVKQYSITRILLNWIEKNETHTYYNEPNVTFSLRIGTLPIQYPSFRN